MLQVDLLHDVQDLTASQIETMLESTTVPIVAGTGWVINPFTGLGEISWDADATGNGLVQADLAIAAIGICRAS